MSVLYRNDSSIFFFMSPTEGAQQALVLSSNLQGHISVSSFHFPLLCVYLFRTDFLEVYSVTDPHLPTLPLTLCWLLPTNVLAMPAAGRMCVLSHEAPLTTVVSA